MKIGIIGDIHLKENLGYSQYINDNRIGEKKEIFDFIIKSLSDCDTIIFGGDQLNGRNNPSEVIREFVEFIERFGDKKIFFLAGNHEKTGEGKTAIDFLKELKNKNWTVVTDKIVTNNNLTFCPYFSKAELGVKTDSAGTKKIIDQLEKNDIFFVHHAISDTFTESGIGTNIFNEPVLPKKDLEKMFKLIVGFHIHKAQCDKKTIVAGSIFNQEVGENQKYIWKIDANTMSIEQIKLPGRGIYKLENPDNIIDLPVNNIVKVILTEKISTEEMESLRKELEKFDAGILVEQYPSERKKAVIKDNIIDYDIEQLIKLYAETKKVDYKKLISAFELIK